MILDTRLAVEGSVALPPTVDLTLVKEQARSFTVRVSGVPASHTLVRVVWTAKASASDADSLAKFQKVVTTTSDTATIGQITDTGADGVGHATVTFVATDLPDTLPALLVHQVWAEIIDSASVVRQGCVARGELTLDPPIPFTLP